MKKLSTSIAFIFTFFTEACLSQDKHDFTFPKFDEMSEKYEAGYCIDQYKNLSSASIRSVKVMALEDVLGSTQHRKSLTSMWTGNLRTFQIGRNLNPSFTTLMEYAKRSDIAKQIEADTEAIPEDNFKSVLEHSPSLKAETEKIASKAKAPLAVISKQQAEKEILKLVYRPVLCTLYEAIAFEKSDGGQVIAIYLASISKEAAHRNINQLNDALREIDGMNN